MTLSLSAGIIETLFLLIYWKNYNLQVEEQPNVLVAWVGGLAAETVDSLADDQIIDCIGHLVRYTCPREYFAKGDAFLLST